MRLDYGTLLSPAPIKLSIGKIRKPTLLEISELGFEKFNNYEVFLKLTPETYFTKLTGDDGIQKWENMSEDERGEISMYTLIIEESSLQEIYTEIFNYFFLEYVVFKEGLFILLNREVDIDSDINAEDVCGVIHNDTFMQVIELIQQTCCIYEDTEESLDNVKYKNKLARKIYEKILKAQKEQQKQKKADINLSLPNIISAVSNSHPSINPINIWNMHVFSVLDSFNRLRVNSMYHIDSTRVSVWGDEKKTFDSALWYKNNYDKK